MNYIVGANTNVGLKKKKNQDSVTVKTADTPIGKIAMCVLCDGMGGLSCGEVASATVVNAFSKWFYHTLPIVISQNAYDLAVYIKCSWNSLIQQCNEKLNSYGKSRNIQLGTTCSVILITPLQYYAIHVGDSRIYEITDESIRILTEDQTFVQREVREGRMTCEQAERDYRKNILLQCIGTSNAVIPQFIQGEIDRFVSYLLCSDGFRHTVSSDEIFEAYKPSVIQRSEDIDAVSGRLININMKRGEEDNITAAVIKCHKDG